MGFVLSFALFIIYLFEKNELMLLASAMFYIGGAISCFAGRKENENENTEN